MTIIASCSRIPTQPVACTQGIWRINEEFINWQQIVGLYFFVEKKGNNRVALAL